MKHYYDVDIQGGSLILSSVISPTSLAANTNDYNPTNIEASSWLRISSTLEVNITGLIAPTSINNKILTITNIGNFAITLITQSASSTVGNRFAFNYDYVLSQGRTIILIYDSISLKWRIKDKENPKIFEQISSITVGNSTVETTILSPTLGTKTIPANTLKVGNKIVIKLKGYSSRTSGNLTIRIKIGATTILTTGAINPGNSVNISSYVDAVFTIRTIGIAGTLQGQGMYSTVGAGLNPMTNLTTNAIDTTIANTLDVTYQWSIANAGNTETITNGEITID